MGSVTRTLEPGISIFAAAEIRVAFVQIGPIPKDVYEEYLEAFNKQRHVPLHAIRALHQEAQKSPFAHTPWRTGALHLRFLPDDDARRRTRIADLHVQRSVLAVLGVVHCPLVEDLAAAHAEFGRVARQFPDALVSQCCAFDPADRHLQAASHGMRDLMLFPAGSPSHLEQHIQVYMHEFGAALLAETENWVLTANVSSVKLNTHVDSAEFTGSLAQIQEGLQKLNINEEEMREKKRWGRLQKTKGDVALISGSPKDAFEHYRSGMELSKLAGDTVWTAAALEGLAHARVMEVLSSASTRGADAASGGLRRSLALPGTPTTMAAAAVAASHTTPPRSPAAVAGSGGGAGGGLPPVVTLPAGASISLIVSDETSSPAAAATGAPGAPAFTDLAPSTPTGTAVPSTQGLAASGMAAADSSMAASHAASLSAPATPTASTGAAVALSAAMAQDAVRPSSPHPPPSPKPSSPTKGGGAGARGGVVGGALTNAAMWEALRVAGIEDEVKELLAEARGWYRKKGGALALQIEQSLKLARFLAGLRGSRGARPEGLEVMGAVLEMVPLLPLLEDRLVALVEVAQVMGLLGCARKRQLLLWAAVDLSHAVDRSDTLALKIATRALEAPDDPQCQDPDDLPRKHWAQRRQALPLFDPTRCRGCWEGVQLAAAEAALSAARQANSPIEAWEAAALIVREHSALLPQQYQASLLEALAQAASRFPQRALMRKGPGPGPLVQLRRVVPPPPALAPLRLAGPLGGTSMRRGEGAGGLGGSSSSGGQGLFIFNPYAQKRQEGAAAAAAESAVVEWAAGDEGRVEVVLVNPLALPLKIDQLTLAVEEAPPTGETKPSMEGVMAGSGPKGDDAPDSSRQSPQRQRQAAGGGGDGARTTTGSDSGEDAGAVVLSPVSVTLPGGGKPVKVQLPLTAKRAGDLLITGVRVTCWGVTWQQPPTLMPRLAPLTAPGALRPQPPQRVLVLAQLPLLRATLTGGDVQVVQPPHDLEGRGGAGAGGVGAGGTGAAAGGGQHASGGGAGGTAAGGGGSGGLGKPTSIPVFEGQHLTWTLTLANVSEHPVGSCSLSVVNAKGAAVRALPQGAQLPASFVGVHVEASGADAALRPAMPLEPRRSVALPLSLVVGRPPADSFEEVMLELRITYTPAMASAEGEAATPSSSEIIGRRLSLPLRFVIQPTLTVTAVRFLQMSVPLRCGKRYAPLSLNLRDAGLTRDNGLYRYGTVSAGRQGGGGGGGLVRNSSEGALPSPSAFGALARHHQQQQQRRQWQEAEEQERQRREGAERSGGAHGISGSAGGDGATSGSQIGGLVRSGEAAAAAGGHAASLGAEVGSSGGDGAAPLGLTTDCVLELGVRNCSERYFRTWLSRLPGRPGADGAESAVVVLEPGDNVRLLCPLLPAAAAAAAVGASSNSGGATAGHGAHVSSSLTSLQQQGQVQRPESPQRPPAVGARDVPVRMQCAERLVESLGVRWEMITGDVAPDKLPRGLVRLVPVDVAHSLSPAAVSALCPSQLHASLVAVPGGVGGGWPAPELADVTEAAHAMGARLNSIVGQAWAVQAKVGQPLLIELQVTNEGEDDETLQLSLVAVDLASGAGGGPNAGPLGGGPGSAVSADGSSRQTGHDAHGAGLNAGGRVGGSGGMGGELLGGTLSGRQLLGGGGGGEGSPDGGDGNGGLLVTGCCEKAVMSVPRGGGLEVHRAMVLPLRPGFYQLGVTDVVSRGNSGSSSGSLHLTQDRLWLLVT